MQERLGSRIGACQQGLTMPTDLGGCSLALPATKKGGRPLLLHHGRPHAGGAQSEWPSAARAAAAAAKQAGCGSGLLRWSRNSCATRGKRRLKTAKQSAQEAQKAGTELRTAEARPRPPRTGLAKLGTHKGRRSDRDTCKPLFFNWPAGGANPTGGLRRTWLAEGGWHASGQVPNACLATVETHSAVRPELICKVLVSKAGQW